MSHRNYSQPNKEQLLSSELPNNNYQQDEDEEADIEDEENDPELVFDIIEKLSNLHFFYLIIFET